MSEQQSCPACGRDDLPWSGRGASLEISGCRFSLYPMDSSFVDVITGALEKTDTSKVWSESDALSTVYRGKLTHVADAVGGLFVNAWRPGLHMAMEGQFSKGCPGDVDGDSYLAEDDRPVNLPALGQVHFPVMCKIALYPLGSDTYIDTIAEVWRMAEARGLNPRTIHYATRIGGDVHQVLGYLEEVCRYTQDRVAHYALTFTLSVNSPTEEG